MTAWNYADVWRAIAAVQPDQPALQQGEREVSWGQFHDQALGLSSWLRARGVGADSKVAMYLYNSPEYLVSFYATLLGRSVPVNTNYRYGSEELVYLFDNADAEAVIFHGTFTSMVDDIRPHLEKLTAFIFVDDGSGDCPAWATPFDEAVATPATPAPPGSPDDLIFLYTGGTTGMPKGVMWRNDDLFALMNAGSFRRVDDDADAAGVAALIERDGPGYSMLPACPLMHGTGLFSAMSALSAGGRVVMLPSRHFDATELASTIDRYQVNVAVIVGDPFARPLLRALDTDPGRYQLGSVFAIVSSGAMWSEEIKRGLLRHHPDMLLVDVFSSSEALGMGASISRGDESEKTARFSLGEHVKVVGDDGREIEPGSDEIGRLMLGGRLPLGYFKDEAKSASTFQVHEGRRYSVPGDMAKVNADGTIQLLGRGSQCINSAGEKVFPEEVEETLKSHPAVADSCVVGVPDEEFGQRIVAAVELHPGESVDEASLISHVKTHLAHYKAPRGIRFVDSIGRAVNGKMDYARHQREAAEWAAAVAEGR